MNIRVLTLSWCEKCKELKDRMKSEGIRYEEMDAGINGKYADDVEDKFLVRMYPIIFINLEDRDVVLVKETRLETGENLRTFDTVDDAIEIIKQYI